MKDKIFTKFFETAHIAKFNKLELEEYEESLKVYRDMHAVIETARDEAFGEGKIEGEKSKAIEVAKNLIQLNLDNETIARTTGLKVGEIEKLRND